MDRSRASFGDIFLDGPYEHLSTFSDVKLLTEDGSTFCVHRVILARENRYFRALFIRTVEDRREFLIPGIRGEILGHVLLYIYTGTVHLTKENIGELLLAVDYLLVDNLMLQIEEFAKSDISLDNCIPLYRSAFIINQEQILSTSYRFIQTHFEAVVEISAAEFGSIPLESVKQFLSDRNVRVRGEHILWLVVKIWVEVDNIQRMRHVPELLQCLHVADVDESLATEIINSDVVARNPLCTEMNDIRRRSGMSSSLDVLLEYFSENSSADFHNHRGPEWMHLIARFDVEHLSDGSANVLRTQIYITYDENVDLWRKLGETEFCPLYMVSIGNAVYMFDEYLSRNFAFNLFDRQWNVIRSCRIRRMCYSLVNLQNTIYVLGGVSFETGEWLSNVEFYNPDVDLWFDAASLLPVTSFASVAYLNNIFVAGRIPTETGVGMVAEVYDRESNVWSLFDPPDLYREEFAFVAYHEKLFVIGGKDGSEQLHDVEVFDIVRRAWEDAEDLPYSYDSPKAIVLNDRLIVFEGLLDDPDDPQKDPPVSWNEDDETWEPLDDCLPQMDLALYPFCAIEDNERINAFLKEHRDPQTQFEKSPFH